MNILNFAGKKKIVLLLAAMLSVLVVLSIFSTRTSLASNSDLFTGVTVTTREAGYSNTFIWASDITGRNEDGSYKISRTVFQTKKPNGSGVQKLPDSLFIGVHDQNGYRHFIVYKDSAEQPIPLGGEVRLEPDSVYTGFSLITRNPDGKEVQRVEITIGFVLMDGKSYFEDGQGTEADPFVIKTRAHLDNVRFFMNSYFRLAADINLDGYHCIANEIEKTPSLDGYWRGIGLSELYAFGGVIDGKGYTISNLKLYNDSFFKYTNGAEIKNLKFTRAEVNADTVSCAIFATGFKDTRIKNMSIKGRVIHNVNAAGFALDARYSFVSSDNAVDRMFIEGLDMEIAFSTSRPQTEYQRIAGVFLDVAGVENISVTDDRRPVFKEIHVSQPTDLDGNITDPPISASNSSGGLAGSASNIVFENSSFKGNFNPGNIGRVGGFVGTAANVRIGDLCRAEVNIYNTLGNISSRYGLLTGQSVTALEIGGNVYVKGNIVLTGFSSGGDYIGALAGEVQGDLIIGAQLIVDVESLTGLRYIGGLVGYMALSGSVTIGESAVIKVGRVEGSNNNLGGLVGISAAASIINLSVGNNSQIIVGEVLCTNSGSQIGGIAGSLTGLFTVGDGVTIEVGSVKAAGGQAGGVIGYLNGGGATVHNNAIITVGQVVASSGSYIGGFMGDFSGTGTVEFIEKTGNNAKAVFSVAYVKASAATAGGFAGRTQGGTFKGIEYKGVNISGTSTIGGFAGSFIGTAEKISLEDIAVTGIATGNTTVNTGGFFGVFAGAKAEQITLKNIYVGINGSGGHGVGGFAGNATAAAGEIKNCTATGITVRGTGSNAGGFIGNNQGAACSGNTIQADVSGTGYVGGFIGSNTAAKPISDITISSGTKVESTGGNVGGFLGRNQAVNSFSNITVESGIEVSGSGTVGGLIGGFNYGSISNSTVERNVVIRGGSTVGGAFGVIGNENTGKATADGITVKYAVIYATSGTAGGLAGSAAISNYGIAEIGIVAPNTVNADIINSGTGNVGGFIGTIGERIDTKIDIGASNIVTANIMTSGLAGGFFGAIANAIPAANISIGNSNSFTGTITAGAINTGGFVGNTNGKALENLNYTKQIVNASIYHTLSSGAVGLFSGTNSTGVAGENGISAASKIFRSAQRPVVTSDVVSAEGGYDVSFNVSNTRADTAYKYQINGDPTRETIIGDITEVSVFARYGETVRLIVSFNDGGTERIYYAYPVTVAGQTPAGPGTPADPASANFKVTKNYTGEWAYRQAVFTLSHNPEISGLKYQYRLNGGDWTDTLSVLIIGASVKGAVYEFRLIDNTAADEVIAESGPYTVNIDLTRPALTAATAETPNSGYADEIEVTLTLNLLPFSEVQSLKIFYGDEVVYNIAELAALTVKTSVDKNGRYTAVLTDKSGREISCEFFITRIIVNPVAGFEVSGNPPASDTGYYMSIDLTIPEFNNAYQIKYTFNGGAMTETSSLVFTARKNGVYEFYIDLGNGNIIKSAPVNVTRIDELAPDLIITYDSTEWYKGSAAVYFRAANIGISGIESIKLYYNNVYKADITREPVYYAAERGDYTFVLTNGAGAVVTRTLSILNIDINTALTLNGTVTEGVTGVWSNQTLKIELNAVGNKGSITSPISYFYSIDNGKNWLSTGRVLTINKNMNATLIFKAATGAGLSAECTTDTSQKPFKVMLDIERPVEKVVYDWKNPNDPEVGTASFIVSASNDVGGYTLVWSADSTDWRNEGCFQNPDGSWTKTFEITDFAQNYYFKLITKEMKIEGLPFMVTVAADVNAPAIGIDIDVIGGSAYELWCPYFTFILSVSGQEPISGITYYYRVTSEKNGQGNELVKWTAFEGSSLRVTNITGYFSFKGVTGAKVESGVTHIDSLVRTDSLVGMRFINTASDSDYDDSLDVWYSYLDIKLQYFSAGSVITGTMEYPGGLRSVSGVDSIRITENGTYTFTLFNGAGVYKVFTFKVSRIDNTVPKFSVITSGSVGQATSGDVLFIFTPDMNIPAGLTYWYHTGDGDWKPVLDLYGKPWNQLVFNSNIDVSVSIMARSSVINGAEWSLSETFRVIINKSAPTINVVVTDTGSSFEIVANYFGLAGKVFVSVDGGSETEIIGAVSPIAGEGLYRFRAVSETGLSSQTYEINIVFVKVSAVSGGKSFAGKTEIEQFGQFRSDVALTLKDAASVSISRGASKISMGGTVNEDGVTYNFTKNGTYTITLTSESGSVISIIFEINKPDYVLICSVSAGVLILISVITILIVLYIRNSRALKRVISAATASDDPNKFVMFKKIK